jgi:hypothetical protein
MLCLVSLFVLSTLLLSSNALKVLKSSSSNNTYYSGIDTSVNGTAFQAQLTKLISHHKSVSYNGVWSAFDILDEGIG